MSVRWRVRHKLFSGKPCLEPLVRHEDNPRVPGDVVRRDVRRSSGQLVFGGSRSICQSPVARRRRYSSVERGGLRLVPGHAEDRPVVPKNHTRQHAAAHSRIPSGFVASRSENIGRHLPSLVPPERLHLRRICGRSRVGPDADQRLWIPANQGRWEERRVPPLAQSPQPGRYCQTRVGTSTLAGLPPPASVVDVGLATPIA